jgi:hypothetical protein
MTKKKICIAMEEDDNVRLGIPMNKLREWNKYIKGAVNEAARKQKPDNLR